MRRVIAFDRKGETLVGSLDLPEGPARAGVLIVSGGNEVRHGAHRGMAMLAADLAVAGLAVFRFDRSGVGDSTGENLGFEGSREDIATAADLLRRDAGVRLIVGLGNCDAASALALFGRETGADAVILSNPWLGAESDALPPPAAIRARYREKLLSPVAWLAFLTGKVNLRKLAGGLGKLAKSAPPHELTPRALDGIAAWEDDATVVLATGDATALAFAEAASARTFRTHRLDTASHSFAGDVNREHLLRIILGEVDRFTSYTPSP